MPLTPGRRTAETTHIRWDGGLLVKRLAAGFGFTGSAFTLGALGGGWFWLLAAVVAIPGTYTLTAAPRAYTAPCPACGALLGASVVRVPDVPLLAREVTDVRCVRCGVYLDCHEGVVREAPFNRAHDEPFYELTLSDKVFDTLDWSDRCVRCGREATRGLKPSSAQGVATGAGATLGALERGSVSYCERHGSENSAEDRGILAVRHGDRVIVRTSLYAAYRTALDRSVVAG